MLDVVYDSSLERTDHVNVNERRFAPYGRDQHIIRLPVKRSIGSPVQSSQGVHLRLLA